MRKWRSSRSCAATPSGWFAGRSTTNFLLPADRWCTRHGAGGGEGCGVTLGSVCGSASLRRDPPLSHAAPNDLRSARKSLNRRCRTRRTVRTLLKFVTKQTGSRHPFDLSRARDLHANADVDRKKIFDLVSSYLAVAVLATPSRRPTWSCLPPNASGPCRKSTV